MDHSMQQSSTQPFPLPKVNRSLCPQKHWKKKAGSQVFLESQKRTQTGMAGGVAVGLSLQVLKESAGEGRSGQCGPEQMNLTWVGSENHSLFIIWVLCPHF